MSTESAPVLRPGVRVLQGSTLSIPAGGLVMTIGADGTPTLELREFRLASSTWLDWLHIAFERGSDVQAARRDLEAATGAGGEAAEADALQRELRASLQVVTAAASGLEGFYGLIEPHIKISPEEREARRRNRTGRAIWVADGIFRAEELGHDAAARQLPPNDPRHLPPWASSAPTNLRSAPRAVPAPSSCRATGHTMNRHDTAHR